MDLSRMKIPGCIPALFPALLLLLSSHMPLQSQENASWLRYPAISPDGKQITFAYRGDIYLVQSTGGLAVPLTIHTAHEYMPVWSPDGKSIAFASDRHGNFDIFLLSLGGGEPRRLTFNSANDHPTDFSPDGSHVLFYSARKDSVLNVQFPGAVLSELYKAPVKGGAAVQVLTTPAQDAKFDREGTRILYHDRKGYENEWRKHHQSSVARDIWIYDFKNSRHTKLSQFPGEDRNPVWSSDERSVHYLSERSGSFNVWKAALSNLSNPEQVTRHEKHPVRFLSSSTNGTLCYSYHGEIYLLPPGAKQSSKVNIQVLTGPKENENQFASFAAEATEMKISPQGKEMALVVRGEIFVASIDHKITKRVTQTPQQERSVSFSPDGRTLLYAGERDGSWNLYTATITQTNEPYFYSATVLAEETVLKNGEDNFQPSYSPDGKEIAYLENRTAVKIQNLEGKTNRLVVAGDLNYSYTDGDQFFDWSPDGKWLLVQVLDKNRWSREIGLVDISGTGTITNLTLSGYEDARPRWAMKGKMLIWDCDRYGMRSHGSWGANQDVLGMFFTREAFDKFQLNKADFELLTEQEKKEKEKEEKEKKKEKEKEKKDQPKKDPNEEKVPENPPQKDKDKEPDQDPLKAQASAATDKPEEPEPKEKEKTDDADPKKEKPDPVKIELDNIEQRVVRLTVHSSDLSDAVLTPDGEKLVYLSRFEKGHDLWIHKLREKETKLLAKLGAEGGTLELSKDAKHVFVLAGGKVTKVELENGKQDAVAFSAEMNLNKAQERIYIFDHVWRQVLNKFYVQDLHHVDWNFYKGEYLKFLPHIDNNWDFTELLSEMLGELNASHTGSGYRPGRDGDATAELGAFFDPAFSGPGLKVLEIVEQGPLDRTDLKIKAGHVIEKIDGQEFGSDSDPLLNRKAGKRTLLSLYDPSTSNRWTEMVKPISNGAENELLFQRWVKSRRLETDRLSKGKIGYVHVRSMNDASFRDTFSELFGRHTGKDAIIIDTRFNGGGWLHDNLVDLLRGKSYFTFVPRGNEIGQEPMNKWRKKSVVLMSESNYSNAHMFPLIYKKLGLGQLVGMPVPGTGTAVWWETQQDKTVYFGIPQVGIKDSDGQFLENFQLLPDHMVSNDPETVAQGRDLQLEKAVEVLTAQ